MRTELDDDGTVTSPVASIVVLGYNKRELTERCLAAIDAAVGSKLGREYELVLVDNGSSDDTPALYAQWADRANVVSLAENRNYSGGANAGARAARGDVLVIVTNDVQVTPGSIELLVEEALDPTVGAVGMRLLYPSGLIQHGGFGFVRMGGELINIHFFWGEHGRHPAARAVYDLDVVTLACFAMRRSVFESLGGFDEGYVNGWEDVDLCLRARLEGHRVVYRGDCLAYHDEGATVGAVHNGSGNHERFFSRFGSLLEDDADTIASLFDGELDPNAARLVRPLPARPGGSVVSVEGAVRSLAPEAAEARALLARLEALGVTPAARESSPGWLTPRLPEREQRLVRTAQERLKDPHALVVYTPPPGAGFSLPPEQPYVVRLAALPSGACTVPLAAWAASPALADALVSAGLPRERVSWVAPAIPVSSVGSGGGGIVALLPAHDLALAGSILDAVAPFAPELRVRLVASVASGVLSRLAHERLPCAELLGPISDESAFAALAGGADVVVTVDPADPFERRALVAASVGAVSVTTTGGPAEAVLGNRCVAETSDVSMIRRALERGLEQAGERRARARVVEQTCGERAVEARLRSLLGRLSGAGAAA